MLPVASIRAAAATAILALTAAGSAQAAVTFHPTMLQSAPHVTTAVRRGMPMQSPDIMSHVPYTYTTIDNGNDPTFNQLLGINDHLEISGYFGSGAAGHPNQGYTIVPPYGQANFTSENFPGSVQTQVVALNNSHDTAGFWIDGNGVNHGFIQWNGVFTTYRNPKTAKGGVNQILGINDAGNAVGFYTDINGVSHAYVVNQATSVFTALNPTGLTNTQATGINNLGDICGLGVAGNGSTVGWLLKGGHYSEFLYPGSTVTQAFGLNKNDVIVGVFIDAAGATHGFRLSNPLTKATWQQMDDPNGVGNTFDNGIDDQDNVVGFYVDAAGNTNGFLATP